MLSPLYYLFENNRIVGVPWSCGAFTHLLAEESLGIRTATIELQTLFVKSNDKVELIIMSSIRILRLTFGDVVVPFLFNHSLDPERSIVIALLRQCSYRRL